MIINVTIALTLATGGAIFFVQWATLRGKIITEGVIVELPSSHSSKSGTTMYGIVAEFKTLNKETAFYRSTWKSSHPGYHIGEPIRIYYDDNNYDINGICTFGARYGLSLMFLLTGLIFIALKIGYPLANKTFDRIHVINDRFEKNEFFIHASHFCAHRVGLFF